MEDGTGPVVVLHGFDKANIHQHGSVECVCVGLVDQVDAIVKLLLDEHGMEVSEEDCELVWTVPIWHDDGHLVVRGAVHGLAFSSLSKRGQLGRHLIQGEDGQVQRDSSDQAWRDLRAGWEGGWSLVRRHPKVGEEGGPDGFRRLGLLFVFFGFRSSQWTTRFGRGGFTFTFYGSLLRFYARSPLHMLAGCSL